MSDVRIDLKAEISSVRTDLKEEITDVRIEMEALKGKVNLVRWPLVAVPGGVATLLLKAFF